MNQFPTSGFELRVAEGSREPRERGWCRKAPRAVLASIVMVTHWHVKEGVRCQQKKHATPQRGRWPSNLLVQVAFVSISLGLCTLPAIAADPVGAVRCGMHNDVASICAGSCCGVEGVCGLGPSYCGPGCQPAFG